ncbi:TetR family transcriptional regulator [[Mycobacterium] kokjensenii]|uniref:TetR/AcrR family transcriptional regulator n=1 Tax=[Mycobacterium] kokjensenii TaxID=3064287 RepID=UPI0028063C2B|nr:TetR family transcriptional regulator [Mycolicibacter sp. MU0083]
METARAVFADVGYERATIRGIATAAGVDKSSIIKYFGTKQQLFTEAVTWKIPTAEVIERDPAHLAENLARGMFDAWAADPNGPMAVLLRTSMTSEDAAEILRTRVTTEATDALSSAVDGPDARLRAALFQAMLMGVASQRYLLKMPDLADVDTDDILRILTPALETLLGRRR